MSCEACSAIPACPPCQKHQVCRQLYPNQCHACPQNVCIDTHSATHVAPILGGTLSVVLGLAGLVAFGWWMRRRSDCVGGAQPDAGESVDRGASHACAIARDRIRVLPTLPDLGLLPRWRRAALRRPMVLFVDAVLPLMHAPERMASCAVTRHDVLRRSGRLPARCSRLHHYIPS